MSPNKTLHSSVDPVQLTCCNGEHHQAWASTKTVFEELRVQTEHPKFIRRI